MRGLGPVGGGLALLLVILCGAAAARSPAAQNGTPSPAGQPLAFDVAFRDTVLAATPSQLSPGDRVILRDRLLAHGVEVGHNAGVCTITDSTGGGEALCAVTWALPGGTLSTQFLNTPPPEKTFAIIGGTGQSQGARGVGVLVEQPDQTGMVTFQLSAPA